MITYTPEVAQGGGGGGLTAPINSTQVDASIEVTANKNQPSGYLGLDANGNAGLSRIGSNNVAGRIPVATGVDFQLGGLLYSAAAYGVASGNTAAANSTAISACISAAIAGGDGSEVWFDWGGTAQFNSGAITIANRIHYKGFYGSKVQLAAGQTGNVLQTVNWATDTQTIPTAGHSQGQYEFILEDIWIDGNKANNVGNVNIGLAIVGFGYTIRGHCFIENCTGPGLWREYNTTQDAPATDSGHQRASRIESLWLANNDCAAVPATNTRLTNGKGAVSVGQYATFGPGDSTINYIEIYRTDAVSGTGYQQIGLDFTAGTFRDFASVNNQIVIWGNHNIGVNLDSTWEVQYLHAEGANTVYQLNGNAQENKIHGGDIFNIQTGGTLINLIGSCAHFCYWQFLSSQLQHDGTMLTVASTSALQEGEVHMCMQLAQANTVTLSASAAPAQAREFDMMVSNFGGSTVTPGFCLAIPAGGTVFRYAYSKQPTRLGRLSLLTLTYSTGVTALTNTATVTAAQIIAGIIEGTPTAAATYTTDTGTAISAAIPGLGVGETFDIKCVNRAASALNITWAGGVGVTIIGSNTIIPQNKVAVLTFRNTGANTWSLYINVSA